MVAGESARREAERRRQSAMRHAERAESLSRSAQAFEKGAIGEAATAAVLDSLVAEGWLRLDDRRWPQRVRANVDHIVVGPGGVFVIDSKNWSSRPSIRGDILYAGTYRKEREVAAAADAALAVAEVAPPDARAHVKPVICFVCDDEALAGVARDVLVCSTATLPRLLRSRPVVLSADQVADTAARLTARTESALAPAQSRPRAASPGKPRTWAVPRPTGQTRRPATRRRGAGRAKSARADVARLVFVLLVLLLLVTGVLSDLVMQGAEVATDGFGESLR